MVASRHTNSNHFLVANLTYQLVDHCSKERGQ